MAEIEIPADGAVIRADLAIPPEKAAVVVFAHGSGSSRHSPRNRQVARRLEEGCLATLLVDLLTEEEEALDLRTGRLRFDIGLLAGRLVAISGWLPTRPELAELAVGYFGASTGAAAALVAAAADREHRVGAVVSRGGRPDLAGDALERVQAPTLLIVGGRDKLVLDLNRDASRRLSSEHRLEVVPGATHLFEEPGALEQVGELAAGWFRRWLIRPVESQERS
jgi:dienelactone hydrolase